MCPGGRPSSTAGLQMVSAMPTPAMPEMDTMSPAPAAGSSSEPAPARFMMRVTLAACPATPARQEQHNLSIASAPLVAWQ
jgi:hypothetical protein